ncbi:MFS transporter [Streptococcus cameli]
MRKTMEHISILSLSLMLVSTFAVSPAIPQMIAHFGQQGIAVTQVEGLITATSFAIMVTLLLNPIIVRFFSERTIMVMGLILMATGGSLPALVSSYPVVLFCRILLGLGLGLINARAINIVGAHYSGKERIRMMGLRGSMEVLGSASLTILAGWLAGFGWQRAFLVYVMALVLLFLFVTFVPEQKEVAEVETGTATMTKELWLTALALAFFAFFVINVNTFITIRIPIILTTKEIGTALEAGFVTGLMQLMGIVSGAFFASMVGRLKHLLLPFAYAIFGLSVLIIAFSTNLIVLGLGAMISGFFYSVVLNIVFSQATERAPLALRTTVMTIVLMGCNIGGATASIFPTFLEQLNPTKTGAFGIYAVGSFVLSALLFVGVHVLAKQKK